MRRTRTLGLGVVMALALFAFPAGASAASGVEADAYPVSLKGTSPLGFTLTTNVGTQSCTSPNLETEGSLSGPAQEFTTFVGNSTCGFFGSNLPLKMNGCKFIFHPGSKAGEVLNGSYDIGPAGCGPITYKYWDCTVSIGAQSGLAATYQNAGTGSKATVTINSNASGIVYSESGSFCESKGTSKNGLYKGTWTVWGSVGGSQVGIRVVDPMQIGLFVTGKESEEEAAQPALEAESYPASVVGGQKAGSPFTFTVQSGPISCGKAALSAALASSANQLAVDAAYGECNAFGIGSSVNMNSCNYEFGLLNAGPPYAASGEVVCDQEGDAVEISIVPFCRIFVGPQQVSGELKVENVGAGNGREVLVDTELTGLEYTQENLFLGLCKKGTFTNGVVKVTDAKLQAF